MITQSKRIDGGCISADRWKTHLIEQILDAVDVSKSAELGEAQFRTQLCALVDHLCTLDAIDLDGDIREAAAAYVMDEICGFGPLTPLLDDPAVSDVLVHGAQPAIVRRSGRLERTNVGFIDEAHLLRLIGLLAAREKRQVNADQPSLAATLANGWRMVAIVAPLASRGPVLTLRRPARELPTLDELIDRRTLTLEMAEFLTAAVAGRLNMLITGAAGAGKTDLLNALGRQIADEERIVVIEDVAQLQLGQPDLLSLETWAADSNAYGTSSRCRLLRPNPLVPPGRFVIDPLRGAETCAVLESIIAGCDGAMLTLHAGDARQALDRLELLVRLAGIRWPRSTIGHFVRSAIDIMVHVTRFRSGDQQVTRIAELSKAADGVADVSDLFVFRKTGFDASGRIEGVFYATGFQPGFARRLEDVGHALSPEMFEARALTP